METVLVTGGAGYIGSHVCKALAAAGYHPVTFDNLSKGYRELVRWGPLEIGDIRDRQAVDRVLDRWNPVATLHFAALIAVGESVSDPIDYYQVNVIGALTLLSALLERARREGSAPTPLIFSSTCAVYGVPESVPITETEKRAPINPYGETKRVVEAALESAGQAYGLPWCALRYFNAAGADPDGETGECHEPETHLIPLAIRAALDGTALSVFGLDHETPDGSCLRDYIHVTDLAAAHIAALKYLRAGGASRAFNIGTGQARSVLEVIASVEAVTGRKLAWNAADRREGDSPCLMANPEQARQLLGWDPVHTDLDGIMQHALAWEQKSRTSPLRRESG